MPLVAILGQNNSILMHTVTLSELPNEEGAILGILFL
jgi:hypothetical protein